MQIIVRIREQQNALRAEREIVVHSQKVVERTIQTCEEDIRTLENDLAEAKSKRTNKSGINSALDQAKNFLATQRNQHMTNAAEIRRITLNVELYDEQVKELSA